jgi:hypothetical protein
MMARAIEIFLSLTLILTTIWACQDGQVDQLATRQGLDELLNANSYPTNPWMFPYYHNIQPRLPFAGKVGRILITSFYNFHSIVVFKYLFKFTNYFYYN